MLSLCLATCVIFNGEISLLYNYTVIRYTRGRTSNIGAKKSKYFGTMDSTQGYHQTPLSIPTRVYTSFIVGNSATATSSGPIAPGNSATTSAVVSDNPEAQSAATLVANSAAVSPLSQSAASLVANSIAANTADIIQMGNVISNDPPILKRAATPHHTVFNMKHAVILSDTVDAKLANAFLVQARDPAFEGHWSAHIQKTALRLIKLGLPSGRGDLSRYRPSSNAKEGDNNRARSPGRGLYNNQSGYRG
jgi:hypothetical protein